MSTYRLALLADLHGNLHALRAVLQALRDAALPPDQLVIAGDLIGGPNQEEMLDMLQGINAFIVRGNAEEYIAMIESGSAPPEWYNRKQFTMVRWTFEHLTSTACTFLRDLPLLRSIIFLDAQSVCVFHGSPQDTNTHLYPQRNPGELEAALAVVQHTVLVCGHSHIPWLEHHNGRLVINPGAVCAPLDGHTGAQYALLDWDGYAWQTSFHCIPYDVDAFTRDYISCGLLDCGPLARAHLISIRQGSDWGMRFLQHARSLSVQAGFSHLPYIPDVLWDEADRCFAWPDDEIHASM